MKYHVGKREIIKLAEEARAVDTRPKKHRPVTLETAFEGFRTACQARALSPNTMIDYDRSIKLFIEFVGDVSMREITAHQIASFLASLKGVGAKTLLNRHIGLAAFWTWGEKNELVDRNVVRLVEKPKPKRVLIEPFTQLEVRALLSVTRNNSDRDRAIVLLLLDTGMRSSELVGTERGDINFVTHKVKVLGKNNKERLLPFSDRTAKALLRHLAHTAGKPFDMSRTTLTSIIARLGARVGVPSCFPHRFRHTFAIEYLRNGGDPYTLQHMLDHSTMTMVARYLKIAQIDVERAHRKASPVENWNL